jgi:type III secretory pathway component EscR
MVLPGMSDGRMFTDYTSNCQHNKNLMRAFSKSTNNEFREYLQTNGDVIMNAFFNQSKENVKKIGF